LTSASYPGNWTTTGTVTPPSVSAKIETYSDGSTITLEDGGSSKPFNQSTLSALSISDPSSYVTSSTATYNLNWGTPDKSGPAYANIYPNASNTLGAAKSYAGISVAGQTSAGPTLLKPSADVLAGWNSGWTGKDVNILVIDSFANRATCSTVGTCHGIVSMMATDYISPGASKFGLDWAASNASPSFFTGTGFTSANAVLGSAKSINVINMSWHFLAPVSDWTCAISGCGIAPTNAVYNAGILDTQTTHNNLIKVLNGESSVANLSNFTNAVLTKSAGNDALDTKYDLTALALSANANTQSRLLIVGALDKDGTVASKASKASYTNIAGTNTAISDRFVMANGTMPWNSTGVKINGTNMPVASGTSFAAPLVAGYAAIVMQKFPNLTAASTSNIILDTARTDTLSCYPSCDTAIYGKGEASLSRALAPVGRLR
jgi:hypothetical protein